MATTSYTQRFADECARCAKQGWRDMMQDGGFTSRYLYFKPYGLSLLIAPDGPEGYELATPERVPTDRTAAQLTAWVNARSGCLPILPLEDL